MDRRSRFDSVVRRVAPQAELIDVRELQGGMSAQITALEIRTPTGRQALIVRQYGAKNIAADPRPATTETTLLRLLESSGLPVPTPWLADDGTDLLGGPYCVLDFVDADGPPAAWSEAVADQFVEVLSRLHRLPADPVRPVLTPYAKRVERWLSRRPERPDEPMRETRIRTVLGERWPSRTELRPSILHGDFWPGNTMWSDGRLRSVIDWEDAAIGDPRSDLANLRLELTWAYGPEAADDATTRYAALFDHQALLDHQALSDQEALSPEELALWDLAAASRPVGRLAEWGLDPERFDSFLARYQAFVDRALRLLDPKL